MQPDTSWNAARAESVRLQVIASINVIDEAVSYINLGYVLSWAGKFREAQAMFQRALEIRGGDENLYIRLANTSSALGNLDDAFNYLIKTHSMSRVNTRLGMIRLQQGKANEAIAYCEADMRQYREYYKPHICIAQALAKKGEFDQAQKHFDRALELRPNKAFAHLSYVDFLVDQQRYEEALDHAREVLRINPADFQAHNTLASIMLATGDLEQARQQITEALRLKPGNDKAMNNLQQLRAELNSDSRKQMRQ